MLHYVGHFPEDSPRSENREDVGEGEANKYLTKSSGKLIPFLGTS